MWSNGKNGGNYSSLARMLSNNVRNITRIMKRDRVLLEIGILISILAMILILEIGNKS